MLVVRTCRISTLYRLLLELSGVSTELNAPPLACRQEEGSTSNEREDCAVTQLSLHKRKRTMIQDEFAMAFGASTVISLVSLDSGHGFFIGLLTLSKNKTQCSRSTAMRCERSSWEYRIGVKAWRSVRAHNDFLIGPIRIPKPR